MSNSLIEEKLPTLGLPGNHVTDLGQVQSWDRYTLIGDLESPILAGATINFVVFGLNNLEPPVEWSLQIGSGDLVPLACGTNYYSYDVTASEEKFQTITIYAKVGDPPINPSISYLVYPSKARIKFIPDAGTPEGDPELSRNFIYRYRKYILEAAWATSGAIPPRLIAALIYREFSRRGGSFQNYRKNPDSLERETIGYQIEMQEPSAIPADILTTPLGLCQMPLCMMLEPLGLWNPITVILQLSNNTGSVSREQLQNLLKTIPSSLKQQDLCDLFNLSRFPKKSIQLCISFLKKLKDYRASGDGGWNSLNGVEINKDMLALNADKTPQNNDISNLLKAYYHLMNVGRKHHVRPSDYVREILQLATLPVIDLYFPDGIQTDYGGFNLQKDDDDSTGRYQGQAQQNLPAQHPYVQTLVTDLRELGFLTAGRQLEHMGADQIISDDKPGHLGIPTDWAVREFQIQAGMYTVAWLANPSEIEYEKKLEETKDLHFIYTGPISGVCNLETRSLLQFWKLNALRCPLVISARKGADYKDLRSADSGNLWFRQDLIDSIPRMFARDFTQYYQKPDYQDKCAVRNPNGSELQFSLINNRITVGYYVKAFEPKELYHGGPDINPQYDHCWDSAKIDWNSLLGEPKLPVNNPITRIFNVITSIGKVEPKGYFDCVNAYDRAIASCGLYHWTLGLGELGAFLSFLNSKDSIAYKMAFARFGLFFPDWGPNLEVKGAAKYETHPQWQNENGSYITWLDEEMDYFRTWHWFYRFVMAGRTCKSFRREMWKMARIRIRDVFGTPWNKSTDPNRLLLRGNQATIGDVFTSELAVALVLRWHVNLSNHIVSGGCASDRLKSAFQHIRQNFNIHLPVNQQITNLNSNNIEDWEFPQDVGQATEKVLSGGIINYVQQQGNASPWGNLNKTMNDINSWAYSEPDFDLGELSRLRLSFPFNENARGL